MAKVVCPLKCEHGYHYSSGDGWDEWDECRCCNPKGENDSGFVTERRLKAWQKAEADDMKRIDAQIKAWEVEMAKPCPKCGIAVGDHANREDEPCKSIEQANRGLLASRASARI